jgi:hypothetical protein
MTQLSLLEPVPVDTQCVPSHILERDEAMRNIIAFAGKRFREQAERLYPGIPGRVRVGIQRDHYRCRAQVWDSSAR